MCTCIYSTCYSDGDSKRSYIILINRFILISEKNMHVVGILNQI